MFKVDEIRMRYLLSDEWFDLIKNEASLDNVLYAISYYVSMERKNRIVYPEDSESIFSVFRLVKPKDVNVIILGQDPYHDGSYDGMAFSNKEDSKNISPSLRNIFKEISLEYDYHGYQNPNLLRWADQGVFLINTILTVVKGTPLAHKDIGWVDFTKIWLNCLSNEYKNNVYMLWGNWPQSFEKDINTNNNLILKACHPSPLSANRFGWFGNNHFKLANEYLKSNNKNEIKWA